MNATKNQAKKNELYDLAIDLVGDAGTAGAVNAIIFALEGFKEVEQSNDDTGEFYPGLETAVSEEIDNDIRVLKSILSKLKHIR